MDEHQVLLYHTKMAVSERNFAAHLEFTSWRGSSHIPKGNRTRLDCFSSKLISDMAHLADPTVT